MLIVSGTMSALNVGPVLCVLTGASRGFGRSLALELCPRIHPNSALLLVSRTEGALRELEGVIRCQFPQMRVSWVTADLGTGEGISATVRAAGELREQVNVQRLVIINNAGSLGDISKYFVDLCDHDEVTKYMSFNVSSPLCLTSSLLKIFPACPGLHRNVVNITSLCALQPYKSWTLYCSGKAARDMMFRVLAEEEKEIRVLSYAPGPMDTDMFEVARSQSADPELLQALKDIHAKGTLIEPSVSAKKLVGLLDDDSYKSGSHVDFYD
ncbi:hypothetical protein GDO86_000018 [Hymenochirus boettgeri]|uniref:Sepiapterin reductase n=1 Tax=Hymenochirus boettgeri TaxID=247094 RepID=A0A8T2KFR8_9PIPI|nr:hypothetical protein GDO86_000018 [Hymenochirus boettgeri]